MGKIEIEKEAYYFFRTGGVKYLEIGEMQDT